MPDTVDLQKLPAHIRERYESYLTTSFYFRDPHLRASFQTALQTESLLKGPYPESTGGFKTGVSAPALAQECFSDASDDLIPALIDRALYVHQEQAVRKTHIDHKNIVVATGTASGKTESFLYPILFELYRQHLANELGAGVRALVLYPMNALANDQRERLGAICTNLREKESSFKPTFGQYIGQTPEDAKDQRRNATARQAGRLPGELVFREEMRRGPPNILLTNYSMLEYLLMRPNDSPLFSGRRWQFIVLDEAHQYRGTKGMEMAMLIRRLKQRLRDKGRRGPFVGIATSATMSSREEEDDRKVVAAFAEELFGEPFVANGIIFGRPQSDRRRQPRRYHAFLRALEGAFLIHRDGEDVVVLNRKIGDADTGDAKPLEIALCRECGQHYYVGKEKGGTLGEAVRDPSQDEFGADYYLPSEDGDTQLCRCCGSLSTSVPRCGCGSEMAITVRKCQPHKDNADQLARCEACGYRRGGIGDPVQEIVHGTDGPNTVIATAIHKGLPAKRRKVLAFTDSRQEAAFFAWYAEKSYNGVRDRNLMLRAIRSSEVSPEGLSIDDLRNRALEQWEDAGLFARTDTRETKNRSVLAAIYRELVTEERRLSLAGVGLVTWFVPVPHDWSLPEAFKLPPWSFTDEEARLTVVHLLDELRLRRAVNLPADAVAPAWADVSQRPQTAYCLGKPGRRPNVLEWGGRQTAVVNHFLWRLLDGSDLSKDAKRESAISLMKKVWRNLRTGEGRDLALLSRGKLDGTFRLNPCWLRIRPTDANSIRECDVCGMVSGLVVRNVCPRNQCPGTLEPVDQQRLAGNHYRELYETALPGIMRAEEHTAQIDSEEARRRQDEFKAGRIHLLSSSTTFEVGVDLGDLDVVFLRNVPPEPFQLCAKSRTCGSSE